MKPGCIKNAYCLVLLCIFKVVIVFGNGINVIFMIADGFGPGSQTMARYTYQSEHNKPHDYKLPLDKILKGMVRTKSCNSLITDSGAGATAYACGEKSYNGAIAGTLLVFFDNLLLLIS